MSFLERTPPSALEDRELEELKGIVRSLAGLSLENAARVTIFRKVLERVAALGCRSVDEYLGVLRRSFEEQDQLLEALTTKETYFFRQEYQFDAFVEEVVPEVVAAARGSRRLTVWSAGCSTGEEAYSIAYLLLQNPLLRSFKLHVVGTDLCHSSIETARRAVYRPSSFRTKAPSEFPDLLEPDGDLFRVRPEVRRLCSFRRANLTRADEVREVGRVDIIFCRNVFIYMDEEIRRRVTPLFHERLVPGGYLFLGHTESLLTSDSPFEPVHLSKDLVYRRPLALGKTAARRRDL